jgi:dihydroneopterin aldolase
MSVSSVNATQNARLMPTSAQHQICLRELSLPCHIGVPSEERAELQTLKANVCVTPALAFEQMEDQIERTIDYAAVAQRLRELASSRPRALLETLAWEMANTLLDEFGAIQARVEVHKWILPECGPSVVSIELRA